MGGFDNSCSLCEKRFDTVPSTICPDCYRGNKKKQDSAFAPAPPDIEENEGESLAEDIFLIKQALRVLLMPDNRQPLKDALAEQVGIKLGKRR
jgi:hypothetical protein